MAETPRQTAFPTADRHKEPEGLSKDFQSSLCCCPPHLPDFDVCKDSPGPFSYISTDRQYISFYDFSFYFWDGSELFHFPAASLYWQTPTSLNKCSVLRGHAQGLLPWLCSAEHTAHASWPPKSITSRTRFRKQEKV